MMIPLYDGFYVAVHFSTGLAADEKRDRADEVRDLVHKTGDFFPPTGGNGALVCFGGEKDVQLSRTIAADYYTGERMMERTRERLRQLPYVNKVELLTRQQLQKTGGIAAV